jgi:hypothetical protein
MSLPILCILLVLVYKIILHFAKEDGQLPDTTPDFVAWAAVGLFSMFYCTVNSILYFIGLLL